MAYFLMDPTVFIVMENLRLQIFLRINFFSTSPSKSAIHFIVEVVKMIYIVRQELTSVNLSW